MNIQAVVIKETNVIGDRPCSAWFVRHNGKVYGQFHKPEDASQFAMDTPPEAKTEIPPFVAKMIEHGVCKQAEPALVPLQGPRFVWLIGAVAEQFKDLADVSYGGFGQILYDRQERWPVVQVFPAYAQAQCLEMAGDHAFTSLAEWFNSLSNEDLKSENIMPTRAGWFLSTHDATLQAIKDWAARILEQSAASEHIDTGEVLPLLQSLSALKV